MIIDKIKFKWGVNDCYTFVYDFLKEKYPENKLPNLKNKYSTKEEAIKLAKIYKWDIELEKAFIITKPKDLINDDIVIIKQNNLECAHLYRNKKLYSMQEDKYLIGIPVLAFKMFGAKMFNYRIRGVK